MAEELLINVNIEGERELDKVTSKVEKLGKTGNKTQTELQKLRNELKEQKNAMLQAEEGSEEYGRALQRAAQIQQRMTDISKQIRAGMMGVGEVMANVSRTASGMAGGFGALTGAAQLFGIENEAVINSIARLQSIMSVASGLAQFADSIDALQELMGALRASTAMSQGGMEQATESVSGLSKETQSAAIQVGGLSAAIERNSNLTSEQQKIVTEASQNMRKTYLENTQGFIKSTQEALQEGRLTAEEYEERMEILTSNLKKGQDELAAGIEKTTKGVKGIGSAFAGIVKSLGPMIAITAAVAALSYGIEKLIEWINKIPKDVELRIAMNEDVYKEVASAQERIRQIQHNIRIASNKDELKLIKERLQEEGIATEEQLKGLNDSKALLQADFWGTYLENVKLAAENEYLIRMDVELRLQNQLAKMRFKSLQAQATTLQKFLYKFDLGPLGTAAGEWREAEKELKAFQSMLAGEGKFKDGKIVLNPVKFNLGGKPNAGPDRVQPTSPVIEQLYPNLTQKQIDDYIKDLVERTNKAIEKEFASKEKPDLKGYVEGLFGIVGDLTPEQVEARFDKIDKKRLDFIQRERNEFEQQMELYMSYADSLASLSDAFVGIYDARMQVVDNYYNAEARLIENSLLTEDAKNQRLAELDQERYNKQKKLFEQQKKWQIATVMLNLASGLMNAYTRATLPVPLGGSPSPFNWIEAGLATAALIGQSVASIAQINAQQLESPSTGGTSASTPNVSIMNPNKTALTTKEDSLNMGVRNAIKQEMNNTYEVKVSEINEVQNRVRVREENSLY